MLPKEPTEEEFCLALRNGLILCNVLNKINPGAVHKVVENPVLDVQATEGAAQSAIQYFENMRNFLLAVGKMKLLTFEASDLEKGGSSSKVVDCILCLKGYYEWKQSGGIGVWRYGGTVRITSFPKESSSSLIGSESADESLEDSESSHYDQLMEFFNLSTEISLEESKADNVLSCIFDHFSLGLLQAYLTESNESKDLPLNPMVIDILMRKVVKDFSALLISQGNQLGLLLKKLLITDQIPVSKSQFLKAISEYLNKRTSLVSSDISKFCTCGGRGEGTQCKKSSSGSAELLDLQQKQLEDLKSLFRETKQTVQHVQFEWEEELHNLGNHVKGLEVAASSYHKVLEENRLLYNQVQDLKGTIRVYCRVRPFLSRQSNMQSTVDYIGENGNIMIVNHQKQGKEGRRVFTFNKVFGTNVTQQQIYADTQPLIRSVLDGYNVCIFAYGQTGSGKTYTMSGPDLTTTESWGVNYRALHDLFSISKERMDAIEYEVGVQMIEIYNEQLNGLNVPDASLVPVKCTQDVLELMKLGQRNRAVGATALNERSSRSHSIITVHVQGKELVSGSTLKGCLHLVDLAGSERVDKSEAVGERLKEAQHINRSLSALGDVISALAQKSSHVPYRNSKLTQVLQDSLGGHAKTLMFVHINPEISSLKLALERKEAELEQLKSRANIRGTVSPLHVQTYNHHAILKPETSLQHVDASQNSELRSCSSGKQRKSRLPSKFTDKDFVQKMPFLAEERKVASVKPRSPSPPPRRSVSTDRGSLIKSRIKSDTLENPPIMKLPFPVITSVDKSVSNKHAIISSAAKARLYQGSREPPKPDVISDVLCSLQRVTSRKVLPENEEDRFKQELNVQQVGIRKAKPENKVKTKHQLSAKIQKSDVAVLSDVDNGKMLEKTQKIEFSDPENEHGPVKLPVYGTTRVKKLHRNIPRKSQNVEPRDPSKTVEPFLAEKHVNKFSNENVKEAGKSSVPEFRRSRSTPRGTFKILP
ncbi:Kinesin KP1 [Abeliophyllum distichum]|uniref:Kinesin KP1 n=1 Tax=Abeliophyllum distichum TaxID=126358 RepID=A0ABD1UFM4_9LAMI